MQTHQKNQKLAISISVIAVIGVVGVMMTASMYFPGQNEVNPSTNMPIIGGTEPDRLVIPEESGSQGMPVPGNTDSETSTSIGMPVPGSNEPEMIVSSNPNSVISNTPN